MSYEIRIENTGGYDYDKKKGKSESVPQQSESPSAYTDYQKFVAEQNKKFENYKNSSRAAFDAYVRQANANFEKYKSDVTDPAPPQQPVVPDGGQVDRAKANQNYANAIANPDNWVEAKAEPAITPPVMEPIADPNTNPTENEKPTDLHMADYLTNLSDETVSYLKGDKKFTESSDKFIALEVSIAKDNALLKEAKENLKNAKAKFENTSYQDFDAKSAAQDEYFAAQSRVQDLQFSIRSQEQDQGALMSGMKSYASTVENWEDGQTHHLTVTLSGYGEVDGFYDRDYKSVTLPNGRKAYEYNGEYYELASDGKPSLFDKVNE